MEEDIEKYHNYLNRTEEPNDFPEDLVEFLSMAEKAEIPEFKQSKEEIWSKIDSLTEESHETKVIDWRRFISVAAIITLLITSTVLFTNQSDNELVSHQSEIADIRLVELPDGSKVTLNSKSKISYGSEWNRSLNLEGEAFFEVVKGSKFTVTTNSGTVEVLGTSFNVYSRDDQLIVNCKTGKVKVDIPGLSYQQVLTPGTGLRMSSNEVQERNLEVSNIATWQIGEFYFDNRPLEEVVEEISRQFDVEIKLSKVEDRFFTGYFISSDLNTALEMVCDPLDLEYKVQESKVVISMK